MMSTHTRRIRRFLPAFIATLALAAGLTAPARPAAATPTEPAWLGYAVTADFNSGQPKILYTVFSGVNGPPATVLDFDTDDITAECVFTDITYNGGYAVFNGTSSQIACALPSFRDKLAELFPALPPPESELTCHSGGAPLWASAQAILDPVSAEQPVINVLTPGDRGMFFKLPSTGVKARSVIELPNSATLTSPQWSLGGSSNRVLLGMNGPSIIALDDAFGWLSYLNPAWEAAFAPVVGATARHWFETPNRASWVTAPTSYKMYSDAMQATIGHNPVTSAYFRGRLRYARIDPGCGSW